MTRIEPGLRSGVMRVPQSKSHAHRVLVAEFLAGRTDALADALEDCEDVRATKRCLRSLAEGRNELDCGESGTTRRLLSPVAAAIGRKVTWVMKGRLAKRPQLDYADMCSGVFELPGDVSSQFVSGLLFALPVLPGDSEIRLTTPLASRGYVEMTLGVLRRYGIEVEEFGGKFLVRGGQKFVAPKAIPEIESDWSGAAFVFALRHLGNEVEFSGNCLSLQSSQPDRVVCELLGRMKGEGRVEIDVDGCPDLFPVLSVVAGARSGETVFTGTRRLRIKESDRVAAMGDVLRRFGVGTETGENEFVVRGGGELFDGGVFASFGDHRIAMAAAVGATHARGLVEIDDIECASKSYPTFFEDFGRLNFR